MNSFSTFGGMLARGQTNVNSMTYINRYAQGITADFSGSSFIDLSNTYQYAVTSSGLNMTNGINGNTFARLKYNGAYLKTADFSSTGSFTIYLKYAARFSLLPPLNFEYPNVIQLSPSEYVSVSNTLTATFYSSLNPGTVIPYRIRNLNGIASQSGSFTSPHTQMSFTITSGSGNTGIFDVSGGLSKNIYFVTEINHTVTVSGGVYWISTNGGATVRMPMISFVSGYKYLFDQSDSSNTGFPLGFTLHANFPTRTDLYTANLMTSLPYTRWVENNGSSIAITVDADTPQPLYYYCTNPGALMGYIPPLALIKYTFEIENGTIVTNSGTAGLLGNGDISGSGTQTISYATSDKMRGTKSLYNNTNGTLNFIQIGSVGLSSGAASVRTYCMWVKFIFPVVSASQITFAQYIPFTFDGTTSNTQGIVKGRDLFFTLSPRDDTLNSYRFCINHLNEDPNRFFGTYAQLGNTWKHIAIVDGESSATIYTDGIKQTYNGTSTFTYQQGTTRPTNTSQFKIMSRGNVPGYGGMVCYVDDYRIYDTTLTDAEIMSIYQNANYNF